MLRMIRRATNVAGFAGAATLVLAMTASAQTEFRSAALTSSTDMSSQMPGLEGPAAIEFENVPLEFALAQIRDRSGAPLGYSPSLLPSDVEVSCRCRGLTVRQALLHILEGTGLHLVGLGGHYVVVAGGDTLVPKGRARASDRLLSAPLSEPSLHALRRAFAEGVRTGTVTGAVMDRTTLRPLVGAQVTLPDGDRSTLTDPQGRYSLADVPAGEATISVRMLGYATMSQTVSVASGGTVELDFEMRPEALGLSEIVVTGTAGRLERRAQGAVIASVDASELTATAPITNVADVLQGRVAGVSLQSASGVSGVGQQIRIRGASSISISSEPLMYIDGVRMDSRIGLSDVSRMNDLNPNDIESIEIVKGPAAATLYGADASAGVIQIITKKGSAGTGFSHSVETSFSALSPPFRSFPNFARCDQSAIDAGLLACQGVTPGTVVVDDPAARYGVMRTGSARAVAWSVRGGGEQYRAYSSISMHDESGTLPSNEYSRLSGRMNFGFFPTENLELGFNFGIMRTQRDLPTVGGSGFGFTVAMFAGTPLTLGTPIDGLRHPNLDFDAIAAIETRETVTRVIPDLNVTYTPVSWLTNRLIVGADISRGERYQFYPKNDVGRYQRGRDEGEITTWRNGFSRLTLNYSGTATRTHRGDWNSALTVGAELMTESEDQTEAYGLGLTTNAARSVSSAAEVTGSQDRSEDRRVGFFSQWEPSHLDRLFLQFGLRADRFAAFGTDVDWFLSPSVRVSFVATEADAVRDRLPDAVSSLRLRGAFGTTGRAPQTGAALRTFSPEPFLRDDGSIGSGVIPLNQGNPGLRPEKGQELEAGFDVSFLDEGRISVEYTFFRKVTKDLILQVPIPPSTGFQDFPFQNLGEVRNSGHELGVGVELLDRPQLGWSVHAAVSTLDNEVVDLGGLAPFGSIRFAGTNRVAEGFPVGAYFTHRVVDYDLANDRAIVSDTLEYMGNLLPGWEGNLSSNIRLPRGIRLYAHVDWRGDVMLYNNTQQFRDRSYANSWELAHADELPTEERLKRWGPWFTASGDEISVGLANEAYIEPAGFIRLNEVSLSYDIPPNVLPGSRAQSATIQLAGRNLHTWTDYSGPDPDVQGEFSALAGRADFSDFPSGRRWMLRMSVNF